MPGMGTHANTENVSHDDATRIRAALGDVLQSAPFRNTHQCQTLLKYVVEHTLAGETDLLRERSIGTDVFGRGPDYEPSEDPIVRVRAGEVRKRLAQYYQGGTGSDVQIGIPSGSYRAVFQWKLAQPVPPAIEGPDRAKSPWLWVAAAALALLTGGIVVRGLQPSPASALDQFWAPALGSAKPILVYNATMTVFQSPDLTDNPHELVPVRGQYTCIGDAYTTVVLTSLFSKRGKVFQIRYGAELTFGALRDQPSILIGAFNNAWTLQTTNELRFVFDKHPTIRDRSDNRLYTLPDLKPDGRTSEDYAIVSRVFDSKTGELLITAAGITQYGTRAAGEFLTSPRLMAWLAASAPSDWPKKNLQVLLRTKIVDDTPGPPSIVTTYFW